MCIRDRGNARRGVPPMPVVDAICAAAQSILPSSAPLSGALVEEVALIARWLSEPGVRIVRTETSAGTGWATPIGAAGRWAEWAATARSAQAAARSSEASANSLEDASEFLGEPHPTREQLFGRTRVDRRDGPLQAGLPGRNPFGVAG